ncbi:MAG TPA: bifunctional UDP-N-acetylglucosamine diphosphorylase/glucosamine-1-phosphate N-acetyltransferase GlmU [candidate division Zixibacteria bacterium]|nr:bifunctional UDP-N-acetylglucosamine diphosphorylase/glucosamine-1-phosphate N-acetyltransferase GlmU [candidate division Zixibacteria bacterium]
MVATAAIVLAAGQGTRMRSRLPKVLHPLAGRPMLDHVLRALTAAGVEHRVVVTGFGGEQVEAHLDGSVPTVRQDPQLGTADAVRCGLTRVPPEATHVLVTMGDVPLLPADLFQRLLREQAEGNATIAMLSARLQDPTGYGRVARAADGSVQAIVEEADADEATRAIDEVNVGTYCFDAAWLRANVGSVPASASGEYYLTDLVALAVGSGRRVRVVTAPRAELTTGINDRVALAEAERLLRRQVLERHLRNGVTIVDPSSTYIDDEVEIGQDARIEPWTVLAGATVIAQDAVIGPNAQVRDSRIGPRTVVWASVIEESEVAEDVQIGPYSHLRPGCRIGPRCRIGNYAELKKTSLGAGTQQHHFSYLGDAEVGEGVNIGAGAVTANYDGTTKHPTVIGDGAFIGVDTMLRAPITIGPGARTGAGAVVTRDVAPGNTVVGIPARPIEARRRSRPELLPPDSGGDPAAPAGTAADRNPQTGGTSNPSDA